MIEQPPSPALIDEQTARWYVDKYGDHISQAITVDFASLRPSDVVLDIGCGSGTAVREAAARVSHGRVIGIDPSRSMLRIAAEQTGSDSARERIEYLDGSAESIPLDDGSVTVALAINTVHHWHDLERGLAEVARVLAPGGRLIISEERLASGRFGHGQGPTADSEDVARALRDAGFVDVGIGPLSRGADTILCVAGVNAGAA